MNEIMNKIQKVEPLIKMRKIKVQEELRLLNMIRDEKIVLVSSMKESQRQYMTGVHKLNSIRTSRQRTNIEAFEASLDSVKNRWYDLFREVQALEAKEKSQLLQVLDAEKGLKAVELLKESYETEIKIALTKAEQKNSDEHSLRKRANAG